MHILGSEDDEITFVKVDLAVVLRLLEEHDVQFVSVKENIDTYGLAVYDGNSSVDINDIKAGSHKLTLKDKIGNEYYFYIEIDQWLLLCSLDAICNN